MHDDDFRKGEIVLAPGENSLAGCGMLAAVGCTEVTVAKKPVVGIISTGNELVPANARPGQGQVRDANASMLAAYLVEYGCEPRLYGIVCDEREVFETMTSRAIRECDVVLLSGGSSKDHRDMTAGVIAARGEVLVHGIAIAPGKPTIIGRIGQTGHRSARSPASAFVVLIVVVRHLLDRMLGLKKPVFRATGAVLGESIPSQKGREEYIRVRIDNGVASPLGKAGLLNTLVKSDGLVRIPSGCEGLEKGTSVEVILW